MGEPSRPARSGIDPDPQPAPRPMHTADRDLSGSPDERSFPALPRSPDCATRSVAAPSSRSSVANSHGSSPRWVPLARAIHTARAPVNTHPSAHRSRPAPSPALDSYIAAYLPVGLYMSQTDPQKTAPRQSQSDERRLADRAVNYLA